MPIFTYACPNCRFELDQLQKRDEPAPRCPECKEAIMERTIGLSHFRLRGPGWTGSNYSKFRRET